MGMEIVSVPLGQCVEVSLEVTNTNPTTGIRKGVVVADVVDVTLGLKRGEISDSSFMTLCDGDYQISWNDSGCYDVQVIIKPAPSAAGSSGSQQPSTLITYASIPEQTGSEVTQQSLPVEVIGTDPLYESRLSEFVYDGVTYDVDPDIVLNPLGSTFDGDYSTFAEAFRTAFQTLTGETLTSFTGWGVSAGAVGSDYTYTTNSFPLAPVTGAQGTTWDGTNYWVVDSTRDVIEQYDASWVSTGFTIDILSEVGTGADVTFDGTHLWVLDTVLDEAFQYTLAGAYTGTSFDTTSLNPRGIFFDGVNFWTINASGVVDQYDSLGVSTGFSFNADPIITQASSITGDGTTLWILDQDTDAAYQHTTAGVYTTKTFSVAAELGLPLGINFANGSMWVVGPISRTAYEYTPSGGAVGALQIPSIGGTADLSLLTSITMENFDGDTVVETQAPSVGIVSSNTFTTFDIAENLIPAILTICFEDCVEVSRNLTSLDGVSLDPSYVVSDCDSSVTELGYAQTITLNAVDDTFTFPDLAFQSIAFYVKQGAIEVSFDSGATYTAQYDTSDGPVIFGQGNKNAFDASEIVIKAAVVDTTIQVIGDYIV